MALDRVNDYPSINALTTALAPKLNVGVETLRKWVVQTQIDAGEKPRTSSQELEEIKTLMREVKDLKEVNESLRAASIFFVR